ncbi:uncharacterized protein LOC105435044 [Cucumis sativus]|nr:uncharacterized protein LOC105435044 [Cucumis sativus]KAE8652666.1 hypothetical protein Csa_013739 [Cucumis sativus]
MVELQACASGLVNPRGLCATIDHESKGETVNVIAQMADELQRERQRNAELMERISFLEAKLLEERVEDSQVADKLGSCSKTVGRSFKRLKRSKEETGRSHHNVEKNETLMKDGTDLLSSKDTNLEDQLVSWMSMDETQFVHCEKLKECDIRVDSVDTDETDDEENYYHEGREIPFDIKDWEINGNSKGANDPKQHIYLDSNSRYLENHSGAENNQTKAKEYGKIQEAKSEVEDKSEKTKNFELYDRPPNILVSGNEVCKVGFRNVSLQKKPPKLAFCPKEVKRIIESEVLLQKNAQSHTMRKIIVFSCLGIRHGCEEIYDLDFDQFSILRKGEPFISPQNPGEHVLYENHGIRRRIFYPNRHNPTLCPVQILEEEKSMRPLDVNCPSCFFLCIKYGGRTRNLPQNEYVRQRMGRNKLKSFGPLVCRMAMLANIRSGSFFFKALGITLLFMAGFPDDLVRKETKYRNLDLLQKYYRTDKDAEGEELFLAHSTTDNIDNKFVQKHLVGRTVSKRSKGKKPSSTYQQPGSSDTTTKFGLVGYTSIQTRAVAAFQSLPSPSQAPVDSNHPIPNPMVASSCTAMASYQGHNSFNYFPPNAFVPFMYWPPPNSFNSGIYPSAYASHSFPSSGNYISFQSQPYCSFPFGSFMPKAMEENAKNEDISEETESNSDNTSSSKD